MSKIFGYSILAGAFAMYIPQILKIQFNKSVLGISRVFFYLNFIMLSQNASNSVQHHYAFSVYGEQVFLSAQECIILMQIWWFDRSISKMEIVIVATLFSTYVLFLYTNDILSQKGWDVINIITSFIILTAKCPQIWLNYVRKSTGQLSFISFFLDFVGSFARLYTLFIEVRLSFTYILQQIVSCILNTILMIQFAAYRHNGAKDSSDSNEEGSMEDEEIENQKSVLQEEQQ